MPQYIFPRVDSAIFFMAKHWLRSITCSIYYDLFFAFSFSFFSFLFWLYYYSIFQVPSSRSHTRIEYSQSQYLYGYTITRKRILLHPQRRIKKGKKKKEEKNAQLSEKHEIMWSAHHFVQNFNFIYIMISITSIERSHYNTINDSTSTSIGPSNFSLSLHSHSCFSLNFFLSFVFAPLPNILIGKCQVNFPASLYRHTAGCRINIKYKWKCCMVESDIYLTFLKRERQRSLSLSLSYASIFRCHFFLSSLLICIGYTRIQITQHLYI